jgi:3-hydroxyacyl-CoA dehydrogenase
MKIDDIKKVAVFGAGTMGPGLAQVFAAKGYAVVLCDISQSALDVALSVLQTNLETFVSNGLLTKEQALHAFARVTPTTSVDEAAHEVDLVIECIIERKDAKKALYDRLHALCPERTVFASNTSYLNIFDVMCAERQSRTVIAHWFAPPHIIPLVEVVRGPHTNQETMDLTVELLKRVERVPVVMEKFVPGFCINRIQRILGREIFFLLDNGYMTAEQLDIAVKASIIPRSMVLGLVQRYDFTGLDLSAKNLENTEFLEPPLDNHPRSLLEHVERGEMGVKSGKGFFDYGGRKLEEVLQERDVALLQVFERTKHLINTRI